MADSVCVSCGATYKRCGSCSPDKSLVCNKCKRTQLIEKKRTELQDDQCLVFIGENVLQGAYTIEQAKQVVKHIPTGRLVGKDGKEIHV